MFACTKLLVYVLSYVSEAAPHTLLTSKAGASDAPRCRDASGLGCPLEHRLPEFGDAA